MIRSAAAIALLVVCLAGCASSAPTPATTKDAAFFDADYPGVFSFENGDCFHDPAINEAAGEPLLNTVECEGAENEVISYVRLGDGAWDRDRIAEEATSGCREDFERLFGTESRYDAFPVLPSETTWTDNGDRDAMCVVYQPGSSFEVDPLSGT
jgi:hypothetical protein